MSGSHSKRGKNKTKRAERSAIAFQYQLKQNTVVTDEARNTSHTSKQHAYIRNMPLAQKQEKKTAQNYSISVMNNIQHDAVCLEGLAQNSGIAVVATAQEALVSVT